jgi:hypothetical protein
MSERWHAGCPPCSHAASEFHFCRIRTADLNLIRECRFLQPQSPLQLHLLGGRADLYLVAILVCVPLMSGNVIEGKRPRVQRHHHTTRFTARQSDFAESLVLSWAVGHSAALRRDVKTWATSAPSRSRCSSRRSWPQNAVRKNSGQSHLYDIKI